MLNIFYQSYLRTLQYTKENQDQMVLITDLSFPPHQSVNDGIDPDLCSLAYTTVAKIDIESAYRLIPVHPDDRPAPYRPCHGRIRSSLTPCSRLVSELAPPAEWYTGHFSLLDDCIMVAPAGSPLCQQYLLILDHECETLGFP